jgi:DNA-binding transcriptional LysR family regulator
MEAQAMMILSGRFIGFLPCHIADPWVAQNRMRRLRPDAYSFASHHFAALRRSDRDHSLIAKFLKEVHRSARPGRREAVAGGVSGTPGEARERASGEASAAMKEG